MTRKKTSTAQSALDADVLIIGAGMCGSILAKELTAKEPGLKVIVVEAGASTGARPDALASYVRRFHAALAKIPNSPYADSPYAPAPNAMEFNQIPEGTIDASGYYVQQGPLPFSSEFERTAGGTSMHWMGQTPRLLPNDLRLKSAYGVGVDWPFDYEVLRPYYERAEYELGVSGDVAGQRYPGVDMAKYYGNYQFPMNGMPQSWADRITIPDLKNAKLKLPKKDYPYPLDMISTPQARNGVPNPHYVNPETGQKGYTPVGGADNPLSGQRCEGNSSCVPICPVQAKYNALKSLRAAQSTGRVRVKAQTVAAKVLFDRRSGLIDGVVCMSYNSFDSPDISTFTLRARIYVLASNTIENAKLLLNSQVPNTSDQIGRNLMDNVALLRWGLASKPLGVFRGPGSTSNIPTFRDGPFRKNHAAFILPLDNWGWAWPALAPDAQVYGLMNSGWPLMAPGSTKKNVIPAKRMFGRTLRECLGNAVSRQFFIHFETEQLPDPNNRVTVNAGYRDALGLARPFFTYSLSEYQMRAFDAARRISEQLLPQLGVEDFSQYNTFDGGHFKYKGRNYTFNGTGHITGTCRMGTNPRQSVVDDTLRCHDHPNLFIVGGAPMPTIATSNPSLTMAALTFRAADAIRQDLNSR